VVWHGAHREFAFSVAWQSLYRGEAEERLAAYDCQPPPADRTQTVADSNTPRLPATSARNEWGVRAALREALPTSGHPQPDLGRSSQNRVVDVTSNVQG
jgi:hypothetical protein